MYFKLTLVILMPVFGSIKLLDVICPPGHHLQNRDEQSGQHKCVPCPKGTFMPNNTEAGICYPCNRCQETVGQIKIGECTRFHDTVCGCPDGQKWEEGTNLLGQGKCVQDKSNLCRKCPKGTHLLKPCTVSGGKSQCKRCGENTYMDHLNMELKCFNCTECPAGKVQVKGCSGKRDDAHCECPPGQFWHQYQGGNGACLWHTSPQEKVNYTHKNKPSTLPPTKENDSSIETDPNGYRWMTCIFVFGLLSIWLVSFSIAYCWKRFRPDVYQEVLRL